jgi:hypothetical protein
MFFSLSSLELGLLILGVVLGSTLVGIALGRWLAKHSDALREPFGVLQAALFGLVALVLAFSLAQAVGRYDARRTAVIDDANAIGTTYLRAQTLAEPIRARSLQLLQRYTDTSIRLSETVPDTRDEREAIADGTRLQRELWRLAAQALADSPRDSAPRLYTETLNEVINLRTVRISFLSSRVPGEVLAVELLGAALGLALLGLYLAMFPRGVASVILAAVLVSALLFVTFDLDRPTRGLIRVPDRPLTDLRASMELPPAASAPAG